MVTGATERELAVAAALEAATVTWMHEGQGMEFWPWLARAAIAAKAVAREEPAEPVDCQHCQHWRHEGAPCCVCDAAAVVPEMP